ncbi:MAG: TIGR03118 family protein [Ginsengibacter sp.]
MNKKQNTRIRLVPGIKSMLIISIALAAFGCNKQHVGTRAIRNFKQVNLVANSSEYHPVTIDPTLLNGFGIAWSPNGVAWVNSVGGHVSELYSGEGAIVRAPVNIPSPTDTIGGLPTGIVFSGGKGFNLANGASSFLFAGFDGVVSGWNPASGNNAKKTGGFAGAAYTGQAIASNNGHNLIYAANFSARRIDVWDTAFSRVILPFADPGIPTEYSPYNIQAVGDLLYVVYAQLSLTGGIVGHVAGAGKGFVSVFNTNGSFVKRFASRGSLNIPWGITLAPANFFEEHDIKTIGEPNDPGYGGSNGGNNELKQSLILVGNFGDGRINAYSVDGKFLGQLQSNNQTIVIDGLWALSFAPSTATSIDPHRLYFSAGPDNEADGLFGYLIKF